MSFEVVEQFEKAIAEFSGAKYCVAVNTGTSAVFLSLKCWLRNWSFPSPITCPARTFVSVPMAIKHAGLDVEFVDHPWSGVYCLWPANVVDSALRFRKGMYQAGFHCLSFHARKHLNIGEGGAILTNDKDDADWLRAARYSGRKPPHYRIEDISMLGWQMYMTPEKAARGLHLMTYIEPNLPDQEVDYPDLRQCEVFA